VFTFAGVRFPIVRLASIGIAFVVVVAIQLFLRRTFTGKRSCYRRKLEAAT